MLQRKKVAMIPGREKISSSTPIYTEAIHKSQLYELQIIWYSKDSKILNMNVSVFILCLLVGFMILKSGEAKEAGNYRSNSMFLSTRTDLQLSDKPKYFSIGRYNVIGYCKAASRTNCGPRRISQPMCERFMCCWNKGTETCHKPYLHILNFNKKRGKWAQWTNWGTCSSGVSCNNGIQTRTRYCEGGKVGTGDCTGDEAQEQVCSTCSTFWSTWASWSACASAELICLVGTQQRSRTCVNVANNLQPSTSCTGGTAASSQTQPCNTGFCSAFSTWILGSCSLACGGGTRTNTRSCTTTPTSVLPASCYSATTSCNTTPCGQDKDIDMILIVDSTSHLDDCDTKSTTLMLNPPFAPSSGTLTSANFPNFVQQNLLVETLLATWRSISTTRTNVGILQSSGGCVVGNPSTYNYIHTLGNPWLPGTMSSTSYQCGSDDRFSQLYCGISLLVPPGDRSNIPNVAILFMPDVTKIASVSRATYRSRIDALITIKGSTRVLMISAADHSTMTAADAAENVLFGQQWACSNILPSGPCSSWYLGTIYDTATVITNLKLAVEDL